MIHICYAYYLIDAFYLQPFWVFFLFVLLICTGQSQQKYAISIENYSTRIFVYIVLIDTREKKIPNTNRFVRACV